MSAAEAIAANILAQLPAPPVTVAAATAIARQALPEEAPAIIAAVADALVYLPKDVK